MSRLLRFTFCFLLFVAQLAPSLPFSFAALSRPGTAPFRSTDFCRPPELFSFLLLSLFVAPLSLHQNRVSGAKSAPLTFEYNRSRGFFRASGKSRLILFLAIFRQKASGFISARVAVQTRVQGGSSPTGGATSIDAERRDSAHPADLSYL